LDEKRILSLNPVVDAYRVGTSIANARVIDFEMDIVEIDGRSMGNRSQRGGRCQERRVSCRVRAVFRAEWFLSEQTEAVPVNRQSAALAGGGSTNS
jgi:nicotinic acid phosphoribosyltransferase